MWSESSNGSRDTSSLANSLIAEAQDIEAGYARGPERILLTAILFDGIQSYMQYAVSIKESERSKYKEAHNWVHSKFDDYIFSFVNVCEGLGINPEYLRYGLANAIKSYQHADIHYLGDSGEDEGRKQKIKKRLKNNSDDKVKWKRSRRSF